MRQTAFKTLATLAVDTLTIVVLAGAAVAVDDPASLADEAVAQNHSLTAMRARSRELRELVQAAGTWRDPVVGVEYLNVPVDSFRMDESPMSGLQFALRQTLPELGYSKSSREVAKTRAAASELAAVEAEVELRQGVEVLYWKLTLSNLLKDLTRQHLDRTQELLRAVRARYEVGAIGQNSLLRLSVRRGRLQEDLKDFDRVQRSLSAGLARTLSREAESQFETPEAVEPMPMAGDRASWLEQATNHRPELARLREEIRLQQQSGELARVKARPDVNVFVAYRVRQFESVTDDGTDFFSAGLSVPIPWGSRKRGKAEAAAYMAGELRSRALLAARLDEIEAELIAIEASWTRAYEKATSYRAELIPAARGAVDTTLSEFSVGKADFSTLYESEVELLALEKVLLTSAVETHLQRAAVQREIGAPVTEEVQ